MIRISVELIAVTFGTTGLSGDFTPTVTDHSIRQCLEIKDFLSI